MTLTYTLLDGAGGYEPGQIAARTQRELTAVEVLAFIDALKVAQLPSAQPDAVDEDGNELITVCADGTQIVLELLTPTRRVFVTRHECELARFPELGELYTTVSRLMLVDTP